MTPLQVTYRPTGSIAVSGEIDLGNADVFASAVLELWDGRSDLVLEVADMTFIDSSGIGALASLARATHCEIVRGARPNVVKVLGLVGFTNGNGLVRLEGTAAR